MSLMIVYLDNDYVVSSIRDIIEEIERSKQKHKGKWPWRYNDNLHDMVSVVATEAGESLQAAQKYQYCDGVDSSGNEISIDDVRMELIQTAATCLKVLTAINESFGGNRNDR